MRRHCPLAGAGTACLPSDKADGYEVATRLRDIAAATQPLRPLPGFLVCCRDGTFTQNIKKQAGIGDWEPKEYFFLQWPARKTNDPNYSLMTM